MASNASYATNGFIGYVYQKTCPKSNSPTLVNILLSNGIAQSVISQDVEYAQQTLPRSRRASNAISATNGKCVNMSIKLYNYFAENTNIKWKCPTCYQPSVSGTRRQPSVSGTGRQPRNSGAGQQPRNSGAGQQPRNSGAGQQPLNSGAGQQPRNSGAGQQPHGSGTRTLFNVPVVNSSDHPYTSIADSSSSSSSVFHLHLHLNPHLRHHCHHVYSRGLWSTVTSTSDC